MNRTIRQKVFPALLLVASCLEASSFTPNTASTVSQLELNSDLIAVPVPLPLAEEKGSTCTTTSDEELVGELPPVIQSIADERREFQMNLGRAMDVIRGDYQNILRSTPDYSIYHSEIKVIDPSGVQLSGLESYKNSINFLQSFIKFWFQERSGLQYRMVYDFCRSSIRVSWHVVLLPKVPLGRPLHIDGISIYHLDPTSGLIDEHKFENLVINDTPVMPPYGLFSILQNEMTGFAGQRQGGMGVPAGI